MKNKVKFGLSNVHIFPITQETNEEITYGTPIKIPGAVNTTLASEGSSDPFYADNVAYYVATANNGYSGSLEIAVIPDEFNIKILGQKYDETEGALMETANDKNTPFAMGFQFEGDQNATRHIFYRCTATRPEISGETTTDTVAPNTDTLTFTATPRIHDKAVKARVEPDGNAYTTFFDAVFEMAAGA